MWEQKGKVSLKAATRTFKNNKTQLTGANGFEAVLAMEMERRSQRRLGSRSRVGCRGQSVRWCAENIALMCLFRLAANMWRWQDEIHFSASSTSLNVFIFLISLPLWSCARSTQNSSFWPWNSVGSAFTLNIDWHIWFAMSTSNLGLLTADSKYV